jgi:hypothetical protein
MGTYTDDDLGTWEYVVGLMHTNAIDDQDYRVVDHGAAMISSGAGLFDNLPDPIARLLLQAIEIGYGQALRDVRNGQIADLGPLDLDVE